MTPRPTPARTAGPAGAFYGTVTRVDGVTGRAHVRVARVGRAHDYGPLDVLEGPWTAGIRTEGVAVGDHGLHDHGLRPTAHLLGLGDRVVVLFVENDPDRPVIVGRVPS